MLEPGGTEGRSRNDMLVLVFTIHLLGVLPPADVGVLVNINVWKTWREDEAACQAPASWNPWREPVFPHLGYGWALRKNANETYGNLGRVNTEQYTLYKSGKNKITSQLAEKQQHSLWIILIGKGDVKAIMIFATEAVWRPRRSRGQEWKMESVRSPVFSKVHWQIRCTCVCVRAVCVCIHICIYTYSRSLYPQLPNPWIWRATCTTLFYLRDLSIHPWILVFAEVLEPIPSQYWGMTVCIKTPE